MVNQLTQLRKDSKHGIDEYYTPDYALDFILPYIKKLKGRKQNFTVWEPACSPHQHIVKYMKKKGINTVGTCISKSQKYDFLKYKPNFHFDIIFTNPPFSLKKEFINKCLEYKKPFILLLPSRIMENHSWYKMFIEKDFTFILPNKRINYIRKDGEKSKSFFHSCYLTYGLNLKEKVVFVD